MKSLRVSSAILSVLVLSFMVNSCKKDEPSPYDDISQIITDAYIYAYPLISMKITANRAVNVVHTTDLGFAPYNQFSHRHKIPDHNFTSVVSPNVDTFYSSAMLDLEEEPMVMLVPDATLFAPGDEPWRYYLIQLMDAWSNVFAAPGVRTTGTGAGTFLISGPDWSGTAPGGMTHYKSPTNLVWLLGRIMVKDSADAARVIYFQNATSLMPLSAWPGPYEPPDGVINDSIDMNTPPVIQVANMTVEKYFQLLCDLMVENPAAQYDSAIVQDMAKVGIYPGAKFSLSNFSESEQDAIEGGYASGQAKLLTLESSIDEISRNGWNYILQGMGAYGDNYNTRAYVAMIGLGANLPDDGVYPTTETDVESDTLKNIHEYTITFPEG